MHHFFIFVVDTKHFQVLQESVGFFVICDVINTSRKTIILLWMIAHQIYWTGNLDDGIHNSGKERGKKLNIQARGFPLKGGVLQNGSIWSSV